MSLVEITLLVARLYIWYNLATKRVISTSDIKWHGFDGENAVNDQKKLNLMKAQDTKQPLFRIK